MKRRLILHLGLSKTGTTSIQGFLRQNPDPLAAAGIVYPRLAATIPDHPSFQSSELRPRLDDEINHVALAHEISERRGNPGDASDRTPLWSAAFRQIEDSGAHTAIVSYENFSARPGRYHFADIESELRGFDVTGIIYLRLQENWALSLYGQKVRGAGRFTKTFTEFIPALGARLIYSRVLDRIKNNFPLDHLIVANFDQAARSGLLEDFLDRTQLPRDRLISAGEQTLRNISVSHGAMLFLLKCNQSGLSDAAFLQVRGALSAHASRKTDLGLRPGLDTATPDEREAMRKAAADDADRLADRYGVTLTAEAHGPTAYRPFDEEDFRAITKVIAPGLAKATQKALNSI